MSATDGYATCPVAACRESKRPQCESTNAQKSSFRLVWAPLLFATTLSVQASRASFGFNFAETDFGEISVVKARGAVDEVRPGNEVLLRGDEDNVSWYVVAAHLSTGKATHILLGYDTGTPYGPQHRILEFKPSGKRLWTGDFGTCEEHDSLWGKKPNPSRPNPTYVDGEWRIWLQEPSATEERYQMFVYKDGSVRQREAVGKLKSR